MSDEPRPGAYGLALTGLAGAAAWMQPVPNGTPTFCVRTSVGGSHDGPSYIDGERADLRLLGGGRLKARRGDDGASYVFADIPPDADLLHPYLAPAAALWWRWAGREAIHGGAFEGRAGAVLLLGGKEAGKSTTLAWLAEAGTAVLADDLAVVDDGHVLVGPRSIDLRNRGGDGPSGGGEPVRQGERARVTLPPAPSRLPLAGVAVLEWGPSVDATAVGVEERWQVIAPQRMYPGLAADPVSLLDLAAVPMKRFTRPKEPGNLEAVGRALLAEFG